RDGLLWGTGTAACTPLEDSVTRSCLQYIEVLTGGANPTVHQDFTFGTNSFYDYYPSLDLDSSDDLITSFTQSSSAEFPSAYVDGRKAGDSPDSLGTPVLIHAGAATNKSTNPETDNSNAYPWGDYSGAGVDPADETSIWVAAEYATSGSTPNWGTWIADARVIPPPSPTATATSTPTATATATTTATATSTVTATPTASGTPTPSPSPTATASGTPTVSATPTATATAAATQTATPTATPSPLAGTLSVSGNLSFGTVKVNSTKTKSLKIKNKGKFPLQVTVGALVPPFAVTAGSGVLDLPKGKTAKVTVQFRPTATGAAPLQI